MDNNMIKVNTLPAPTWNWLKVNDIPLSLPEEAEEVMAVTDLPGEISDSALLEEEDAERIISAESGMGKEFANWIAACPVDPVTLTTTIGMQPEKPAVIRLFGTKGSTAAMRSRLVARRDSEMTVVMYISGGETPEVGTLLENMLGNEDGADTAEEELKSGDAAGIPGEKDSAEDAARVPGEKDSTEDADGSAVAVETRILLEAGAKVHLVQICDTDAGASVFADVAAVLGERSEFSLLQITLGRRNTCFGAAAKLAGDSSRFQIDTAYTAGEGQLVDINYVARHRGRDTDSEMKVNGVLRRGAKKTFRGTIDFIRGCEGAKGDEREDVLLLDEDVVNKTVPLILCTEESVEGTHGATIGDLSEESLYYFRSRGISDEKAYDLLAAGRMAAAIRKIPDEALREELLKKYGEM